VPFKKYADRINTKYAAESSYTELLETNYPKSRWSIKPWHRVSHLRLHCYCRGCWYLTVRACVVRWHNSDSRGQRQPPRHCPRVAEEICRRRRSGSCEYLYNTPHFIYLILFRTCGRLHVWNKIKWKWMLQGPFIFIYQSALLLLSLWYEIFPCAW